jgi:lipopolysaccharide transport system ATP-binding protein
MSIAIKVENLSKCYNIYENPRDRLKQIVAPHLQRLTWQSPKRYFREFWALKGVSFEIKKAKPSASSGAMAAANRPCCKCFVVYLVHPWQHSNQWSYRSTAGNWPGFNPEFTGREHKYMNLWCWA